MLLLWGAASSSWGADWHACKHCSSYFKWFDLKSCLWLLYKSCYLYLPKTQVFFYIDPEFETDPRMDGINNVILSYTFFKVSEEWKGSCYCSFASSLRTSEGTKFCIKRKKIANKHNKYQIFYYIYLVFSFFSTFCQLLSDYLCFLFHIQCKLKISLNSIQDFEGLKWKKDTNTKWVL